MGLQACIRSCIRLNFQISLFDLITQKAWIEVTNVFYVFYFYSNMTYLVTMGNRLTRTRAHAHTHTQNLHVIGFMYHTFKKDLLFHMSLSHIMFLVCLHASQIKASQNSIWGMSVLLKCPISMLHSRECYFKIEGLLIFSGSTHCKI